MDEENKTKKKLNKKIIAIAAIALALGCGGITGLVYANQKDAEALEQGMAQTTTIPTPIQVAAFTDDGIATTNNSVVQGSDAYLDIATYQLDQHAIIVSSAEPKDATIQAKDAARIGLEAIEKDAKQKDDSCMIELYHLDINGVGKSKGTWVGVTSINNQYRYEFRINDETGEVNELKSYVATDSINQWKLQDSSNYETIIDAQDLAAFTKIEANKIHVANCEVVKGNHYGVYIRYYSNLQSASYKVENGTLYVNVDKIKDNNNMNGNEVVITITVPADTKFDSVAYSSYVGEFTMGEFYVKDMTLNLSCGDVAMNGTSYDSAEINASCGDIIYSNCKIKNSEINTSCGDVDMIDSTMNDTAVHANCGCVTFKNVVSNQLEATANCGNIYAIGDFTGKNDLSADYGDVIFGTSKEESKYSYHLSESTGSIFVDNELVKDNNYKVENSSDANTIRVSTNCGDAAVFFHIDPKKDLTMPEGGDDDDSEWDSDWSDDWGNDWNSDWIDFGDQFDDLW